MSNPLNELLEQAEQGNAEAQYKLGICYFLGRGVEKDPAKAVRWFKKAAEQGHANAQLLLNIDYCVSDTISNYK